MNIAISPERNRCSFYAGGISSAIHDVDLDELFGGGETHADIVSKLAALYYDPILPGSPIPPAHYFQSLLHVFVGFCSDEERAQSLPSAGYRRSVLCLPREDIQTRRLQNESITTAAAIGPRVQ